MCCVNDSILESVKKLERVFPKGELHPKCTDDTIVSGKLFIDWFHVLGYTSHKFVSNLRERRFMHSFIFLFKLIAVKTFKIYFVIKRFHLKGLLAVKADVKGRIYFIKKES